jgi:hypothetical protein
VTETPRRYPISRPADGNDSRFTMAVTLNVAKVLEKHGFPTIENGRDWVNLQQALFDFIYAEQGQAGYPEPATRRPEPITLDRWVIGCQRKAFIPSAVYPTVLIGLCPLEHGHSGECVQIVPTPKPPALVSCALCGQPLEDDNCPDECSCETTPKQTGVPGGYGPDDVDDYDPNADYGVLG